MTTARSKTSRSTRSRVALHAVVRAWLATDENNIMSGQPATCLYFGKKPVMAMGWWRQEGDVNGRWPVPNILKQKRGEICRVTICPNAAHKPSGDNQLPHVRERKTKLYENK